MADYPAYFTGGWVPFGEGKFSPLDRGFEVGDVVFDVARTFNGKSFRMKEHLDRLYRSLKYVRPDPGLSQEEFFDISEEALERNEIASLPGGIFTRGFIRTYAVEVGLDPESTVRVFLASFSVDAEVDLSADADVQEGDSAFEHRQQIARVWFQLTVFSVLAIGLIAYLAIAGSSASAAKDTVTPLRVTGADR